MPKEVYSVEEFLEVAKRASECRVKLGYRRKETEEGRRRIQVLKVKARTKRYLYTLVFEDISKGLEFVKKLKDVCPNLVVLDEELEKELKTG
jgi:large subunit ribosomal protein L38e